MSDQKKGSESELSTNKYVVHEVKVEKKEVSEVGSQALEAEDAFQGMYVSPDKSENMVIRPPYDRTRLLRFRQENNTLGQCIAAMEVNVDGTGYEIERRDEEPMTDEDKNRVQGIKDFFDEPWPGMSMTTLRRKARRDLESVGDAYLEVLTNAKDEIVFIRCLEAQFMRICKLSDPVPVKKTIQRNGTKVEMSVNTRERVFVQKIGSSVVYFREFGASRDVDVDTGEWAKPGERLPYAKRGSQIIHLKVQKDADTPYGIPRWINQLPSVVGSRKAEEFNLEYFDNGGIPPAIVFLSGGTASDQSIETLTNVLSGKNTSRAAVVEVQSTSGSIDSAGKVEAKVERFGAEQKNDSMFEAYNEKNEARIRSSFRLPPLFIGKTDGHNYATAFVSYMIAENQVFKPERDEFDEIINVTLMRALQDGDDTYWYRSKPMTVSDVEHQIKGLELAKDVVSAEDWVTSLNEATGLGLKFDQKEYDARKEKEMEAKRPVIPTPGQPGDAKPGEAGNDSGAGTGEDLNVQKSESPIEVVHMVDQWVEALKGKDKALVERVTAQIVGLSKSERALFNSVLASKTLFHTELDFEGSAELCGCAAELCGGIGGDS